MRTGLTRMSTSGLWRLAGAAAAALLLLAAPAAAQSSASYGDWVFASDGQVSGATTTNTEGVSLGIACDRNCLNYIQGPRPCQDGTIYPAVIETSIGSYRVRMVCHLVQDRYALIWTPTNEYIDVLGACTEIKFIVPLGTGNPTTFRFSLQGGYEAVYAALAAALSLQRQQQPAGVPLG